MAQDQAKPDGEGGEPEPEGADGEQNSPLPTVSVDTGVEEDQASSSGSSGSRGSSGFDDVGKGAAAFVFNALSPENYDGDFHLPVFDEDATNTMGEQLAEALGFEAGTPISAESVFGVEFDGKFSGSPRVGVYGEDVTEEDVVESADFEEGDGVPLAKTPEGKGEVDRHTKIAIGKSLNGHYADQIVQRRGEGTHIMVGSGSRTIWPEAAERAKYLRIKYVDGKTSDEKRCTAKRDANDNGYTESDYKKDAEKYGFDP